MNMNNRKKIFFRADAGVEIGYGHFIRTLALADMLKNDFDCTFFTQIPTEYQRNEAKNVCPLAVLPNDDTKFALFLDKLAGDEIVVLDNYFFTTDYQRDIKAKGCTLVCIDDMHDKHYVADVVINYGANNPELFDIEPYTKLCLGLDWALLRKPFLEAAKNLKSRSHKEIIENVVVCFGGSDIYDLTGKYIDILLQNTQIQSIIAVVGDAYQPHNGKKENKKVRYLSRLSAQEMADLFCQTDCVVCSASTTCIEALACGTKVAAGWYVENQKEFYEYLVNKNIIFALGNFATMDKDLSLQLFDFENIKFSTKISDNYINLFNQIMHE